MSRAMFVVLFLVTAAAAQVERPRPYPVVPDQDFQRAVKAGTRTDTGVPGEKYWQNTADYVIHARILPEHKRLEGKAVITYHNNSPDTLRTLRLSLLQNIHTDDAMRLLRVETTDGIELHDVVVGGMRLHEGGRSGARYFVNGTSMTVFSPDPLPPGGTSTIAIDYAFAIPQKGISARMGYDTDSLFYIGYWYPQMQVFNDVVGWQSDAFLGVAEFYAPFGDYEYTIEMPEDWLLWGTGELVNAKDNLSDAVFGRLKTARESDETYRIVGPEDFGTATKKGKNGWLSWTFSAKNVHDVAFLATRHSTWEAARTPVGKGRFAMAHAFWRETQPKWKHSVEYTQKSIAFLSGYTSVPYPWPHMTAVEADGIIGGGMEFPMMTVIGGYDRAPLMSLFGVHAHEEAHMWVPMIVNTDERRYSWMDEGTTSFHTDEAIRGIFPDSADAADRFNGYLPIARAGQEGEIMRWSNFHSNGWAYGVASYAKPASILHMYKGVLGEEMFLKAYRKYMQTWAWKHPYPWDMFNIFSAESGKDLSWFVRAWYYETWTLDQAVAGVEQTADGAVITVEDKGWVPMPVLLTVTHEDGSTGEYRISEDEWLSGKMTASITVPAASPVVKVEIDPKYYFADLDRKNNVWEKQEAEGSRQ